MPGVRGQVPTAPIYQPNQRPSAWHPQNGQTPKKGHRTAGLLDNISYYISSVAAILSLFFTARFLILFFVALSVISLKTEGCCSTNSLISSSVPSRALPRLAKLVMILLLVFFNRRYTPLISSSLASFLYSLIYYRNSVTLVVTSSK